MTNTTQETIKKIKDLIDKNEKTLALLEYKQQNMIAIYNLSEIIKRGMVK